MKQVLTGSSQAEADRLIIMIRATTYIISDTAVNRFANAKLLEKGE
jgi:hypothetical protein